MAPLSDDEKAQRHAALAVTVEERRRARLSLRAAIAESSPWLTADDAAVYARRGRRQIRKAVEAGRLRAACVGARKQILTRREWIDEYIAADAKIAPLSMRRHA